MNKRKRWYLVVMIHTMLLMVVSFLLLKVPYTYDSESQIISWVKIFKNVLLKLEDKPSTDEFLLVNISYQKQLVPRYDAYGFEIGNEAITDRYKLAEFLDRLAVTNQHAFLFCDIFLNEPSDADSTLAVALSKTRHVLFPYHVIDGAFIKPVVSVASALSDYQSDFGNFTKYTYLQHDTCKTIALAMHQKLHNSTYENKTLYAILQQKPVLNSFILHMPIRQYDIFRDDTLGYNAIHLQNLLELPAPLFDDLVKDRIIVVGDFLENDFHNTFYGSMAGPLIHLNAYLNLRDGKNQISIGFVIYVLACNLLMSIILFSDRQKLKATWLQRLEQGKMGWLMDYIKYAFSLLVISVISYLIFGIYLNILLVSLYFSVAENVIEWTSQKLKLK